MTAGTLHVVGVGPGDPELMTLKAARIVAASPVVAYLCKRGCPGHARFIAARHVGATQEEMRFEYPYTTERDVTDPCYLAAMGRFYERAAQAIAGRLDAGQDVALLCEGDPFFYGSAMYLFDRLGPAYRREVVPGVTGMSGCWTRAGLPMTHGDDVLAVLPGTMAEDALVEHLRRCRRRRGDEARPQPAEGAQLPSPAPA